MIRASADPAERTVPAGPRSVGAQTLERQLWLKEMERAQSAAWLAAMGASGASGATQDTGRHAQAASTPARAPSAMGRMPPGGPDQAPLRQAAPSGQERAEDVRDPARALAAPARATRGADDIPGAHCAASPGGRCAAAGTGNAGRDPHAHPDSLPACASAWPTFMLATLAPGGSVQEQGVLLSRSAPADGGPRPANAAGSLFHAQASAQVHIHLETRDGVSTIWLGVPADMLDPSASGLQPAAAWAQQLRLGLSAQGIDVRRVVLNGRLAWSAAAGGMPDTADKTDAADAADAADAIASSGTAALAGLPACVRPGQAPRTHAHSIPQHTFDKETPSWQSNQ